MNNFLAILRKYKISSILNILGLAAAFSALYIILVQINYDTSYNRAIEDHERIFRIETQEVFEDKYYSWICRPLAELMIQGNPVIESYGTGYFGEPSIQECCLERNGVLEEIPLSFTEISLGCIDVFSLEAIEGDFKELEKPKTVAISQAIAKKYHLKPGDYFYSGSKADPSQELSIGVIFKGIQSSNTDLSDLEVLYNIGNNCLNEWSEWSFHYFIKLTTPADRTAFCEQAVVQYRNYLRDKGSSEEEVKTKLNEIKIRITPIADTYFSTDAEGSGRISNRTTTYILLSIAVLVVLIALINFINFFFALVPIRIRAVNAKKIFGCSILRLRVELIGEALGTVILSLLLAWCCVDLIKNSHIANCISVPLEISKNLSVALVVLFTGIVIALSGSVYPSFYITSFPSSIILKGSFSATRNGQRIRILLIGLQFTISIALIISTLLIKIQHSYMMNYNMGFNKEMLFSCYLPHKIIKSVENREAFSSKIKENPQIKELAFGDGTLISAGRMNWGRDFKDKEIKIDCMPVSWNFLKMIGINIVGGRDFIREDEFKENGTFILNKQAAGEYGITLEDKLRGHNGETDIVGFCENFNFKPLQYRITPFAFYVFGKDGWRMPNHMYLRTTENANIPEVIEYLKNTVMQFDPDARRDKLEVEFFDQELGRQYKAEQRLTTLISLFTALSIIISLMGVFGLVMFETQYRQREIGLRRVHGATIVEILNIFNFKFIKIIGVCFLIAAPISYLAIDRWLGTFAYRTPIHWWVFALSLCIVLLITVTLVTLRSLKAATDNPVDAIKCE